MSRLPTLTLRQLLPPLATSGWDVKFIDHLEDDYNCNICLLPLKDSVETLCSHCFCAGCLNDWLKQGHADCPLCRSPVQINDVHPSTYLRRKINALHVECEWKCGEIIDIASYDKHRHDSCPFIHSLQVVQQYGVGNTAVDRKSVDAVKSVLLQLPVKLIVYVLDKLRIDRSKCLEKHDMIDTLIHYADESRVQMQRYQSGDVSVIYEHWSIKELKHALQSKGVDTSGMIERHELQQSAYQHNIRNKIPIKVKTVPTMPTAHPVNPQPHQQQQRQQQAQHQQRQQSNDSTSSNRQSTTGSPHPQARAQAQVSPSSNSQSQSQSQGQRDNNNNQHSSSYSYTSTGANTNSGTSTGTGTSTSAPPNGTRNSNCTYNFVNAGGNAVYQQTYVNSNTNTVNINQATASDAGDNCAVA
jgi:hypothetical protein